MHSTKLALILPLCLLALVACPKDGDDDDGNGSGNETAVDGTTDGSETNGTTAGESGTADGTTTEGTTTEGTTTEGTTTDADTGIKLDAPGDGLHWYTTCGDPVCNGYGGPWRGVPMCPDIQEGDPCDSEGATCDFGSDCNALFICAAEDPKQQEGGCPISRREYKRDIDYLGAEEARDFYDDLMQLRLATYRYRARQDGKLQLGVILEDGVGADGQAEIWADPANDRVDLYNYSSLAIVGVQTQAAELEQLRAELAALRKEVAGLKARCE